MEVTQLDPITQLEYDEGVKYLRDGNYKQGWPLYEKRYGPTHDLSKRWQGDYQECVVLYNLQGFGDCIQFLRYIPIVKQLCNVIEIAFQSSLTKLVVDSFPYVKPIRWEREGFYSQHKNFQKYPITSLGYLFNTTLDTIPRQIPYLKASTIQTNKKIGICWETSVTWNMLGQHPSKRIIPRQLIDPLLSRNDVISLVLKGDWSTTAAIVNDLDLIISGDFAVAHLAGALGKPVWIVLPHEADWRWLKDRIDSPWYPTARLFRQPEPGNWTNVLKEVGQELDKYPI